MSNTKQQNRPDPVEMLYIESPSITLKQFREAIDRLVTKALEDIKRVVSIQGDNGNWNYNEYMHGMYNGMELILAMLENREPQYKDTPKEWLEHKAVKSQLSDKDNK